LSENDRAFFEPQFGDDFSQVRVHTDIRAAETAKSLKTRAFTVGRDIAFGAGQYAPESHEGRQLLAHELTHVVQQNDGVSAYIQRNNPRSVSNMTMQEKWSIVYEAAVYGAGGGMVMALTILLGFILLIALAAVILGIICPPCIATISAFLATTIWGASVAIWLTALLASIGAAVAIGTMRSEYAIVNTAVGQAQTEDDLRRAGQRWGHNTGRELVNLIASIFAASSRVRTFVGNLARRLSGLRSAPRPTLAESRRELHGLLEARIGQINAARGDLTIFNRTVRVLTSRGNTVRPLADVATDVNELLTGFRRVRTVTEAGRYGHGTATWIESLDGRFTVRITHSQVGAAPVGEPPVPRIHIFTGRTGGHGSHVCLPSGTTLNDIMGALGL
ncbi:MAG: DUF4157 domain-containing protein, partial [Anaerolineales bacterium]|nr:DUF4157 domain-containing protein [Anaerolineales bacterium]